MLYKIQDISTTKEGYLYVLVHFYNRRLQQVKDNPVLIEDFIFIIDLEYDAIATDSEGNYITTTGEKVNPSSEFATSTQYTFQTVRKRNNVKRMVLRTIERYIEQHGSRRGNRTLPIKPTSKEDRKGLLQEVMSLRNKKT